MNDGGRSTERQELKDTQSCDWKSWYDVYLSLLWLAGAVNKSPAT